MERSLTHPFVYELDCTQYNGVYKKTKTEWIKKQVEKEYNYNIEYNDSNNVGDKKLNEIKK